MFRLDLGYLADATGFAVMATYICVSIVSLNKSSGLWFTDVATDRYFFVIILVVILVAAIVTCARIGDPFSQSLKNKKGQN
ncbi:hypothetical protein Pse7367_2493 [Thalassoporum mexicanum PCC 7367]|nr:hypothetical protein Pse7367_2493 [Pseudanabaena sp. PCC 7367]